DKFLYYLSTQASLCLIRPLPPIPPHLPYTTLFRSVRTQSAERLDDLAVTLTGLHHRTGAALRVLDLDVPGVRPQQLVALGEGTEDRKSTRLNSSHVSISYAVFCSKKTKNYNTH